MPGHSDELLFVVAVSDWQTLQRRLLTSPCLKAGGHALSLRWNARSAADALNPVLDTRPSARWVIWVHQDVVLPQGWDEQFLREADQAPSALGLPSSKALAAIGVYGISGTGDAAQHAGHVLDRGQWLHGTARLPCRVDSLDELLFALPSDTALRLDAGLGFDLYATDVVLQAQEGGLHAAVIDAPCEHWSNTPASGAMPEPLIRRVASSGDAFEVKWAHRLPVRTPSFDIRKLGDVRRFAESFPRAEASKI